MKKILSVLKKEYLYCLLFVWVMVVDQRAFTAMNESRVAYVQSVIIPFLIILLLQMKWNKEQKKIYLMFISILSIFFVTGAIYIFNTQVLYLKYIILWLEILIYIFVIFNILLNRRYYLNILKKYRWISILWLLILLMMGIARFDGGWTWLVFAIMIPMTLLDISKEELYRIETGLIYGVILSYFLMQGLAFLIRPYDIIRYQGIYSNPNLNTLFYAVVFIACLANARRLRIKESKKWTRTLNTIIACSAIAFTALTGSKTGMIVIIGMLGLYCVIFLFRKGESVVAVGKKIGIWVITSLILIPVCYSAARYMPHIWSYTVYFYGEYSENKIHSYDPYNSSKYPETEEIVAMVLDRYLGIEVELEEKELQNENPVTTSKTYSYEEALDMVEGTETLEEVLYGGITSGLNSYTARLFIWNQYFIRLNWFGHPTVTSHAHNVFLEYLYHFGMISGGLFLMAYIITAIYQLFVTYKSRLLADFIALAYFLLFGAFGMLELDWYRGQASLTLFFFSICLIIWNKTNQNRQFEDREVCVEKENG